MKGPECLAWNKQSWNPDYKKVGKHNQCRYPGKAVEKQPFPGVWCFTAGPDLSWGVCDVRDCYACDKGKKCNTEYIQHFGPGQTYNSKPNTKSILKPMVLN